MSKELDGVVEDGIEHQPDLSAFPFWGGVSDLFSICHSLFNCVTLSINVSYFSSVCHSLLFNVCVKYCISSVIHCVEHHFSSSCLKTCRTYASYNLAPHLP
jgi:hypothetical protein